MTDLETLKTVGNALFGNQWQSDIAAVLDIQTRTVRYWVRGGRVPAWVWPKLHDVCRDRIPLMVSMMEKLSSMPNSR